MRGGYRIKKYLSLQWNRPRWQLCLAVVICLFGIGLSTLVYTVLRGEDRDHVLAEFERSSRERIAALRKAIASEFSTLRAVGSFFDGSKSVEKEEFEVFARSLAEDQSSIQTLEWAPRVPANERAEFEQAAARQGLPDFAITELGPDGQWIRPTDSKDSFPIFYLQSQENTNERIGCDLASLPKCAEAMAVSCDTGECVLTGKTPISNDASPRKNASVRCFFPIYQKSDSPTTIMGRRTGLRGYVVGTICPDDVIREALAPLTPKGINLKLRDETNAARPELLSSYLSRALSSIDKNNHALSASATDLRYEETINTGGRRWIVECTAIPMFVSSRMTWSPWVGAGSILLLTGLVGVYLTATMNPGTKTSEIAEQLIDTNRRLRKEIADREQIESELWTSELKYKTLFDTSRDAILLLSKDGEFLEGNQACFDLFGYTDATELYSLKAKDLSPPIQPDGSSSTEKVQLMLDTAIRKGYHQFSWTHRRRDGSEFLCTNTLTRMEVEGSILFLVTVRDITEERRKEEALQASEHRYRRLFEQSADPIFVADAATRMVVDCNKKAELVTGFSRKEILAMRADQLHPLEVRKTAMEAFAKYADGSLKTNFESLILCKMGEVLPVSVSASVVELSGKQYLFGIFSDIRAQKQVEEQKTRSLQRLEGVNRLQEDLLLPGTLAEKLNRITDTAVELLDLDFCRIWHIAPGDLCANGCIHASASEECHRCKDRETCLHLIASSGRYTHLDGGHRRVPLGCYKIGRIATGQDDKFLTNKVTSDPRVHNHEWAKRLGLVSFAGYKLHDAGNQPIGVLAMFSKHTINEEDDAFLANVAEIASKVIIEKKAEQVLQSAERRLRLFVENVSEIIWTIDFESRLTYISPSVENWLGYKPDELINGPMSRHMTPSSAELVTSKLADFLTCVRRGERPTPRTVELQLVHQNGELSWGEATYGGMYDEAGNVIALQGICRDISDRKRADEERSLSTQRMESLLALNQMADRPIEEIIASAVEESIRLTGSEIGYLAMMNKDESVLTIQYWSKSAHRMCQVIDKPISYPIAETGLWGEAVRQRRAIITNDYAADNPYKRGLPEGHVPIRRHMNLPIFEGDRIVAVAGVGNKHSDYDSRDKTQLQLLMDGWWQIFVRKNYEIELAKARDDAEAATRAKSRFLATMSHEIRTPMTAILGYAEMLMDPEINSSSRHNYLAAIRRSGEHLLGLINDILDLSKIEAGKMMLDIAKCNVVSLLADVASVVRPRAESRSVAFSIEYLGEIPETILTDGSRLRQTIINLAGNAVKFTEKGSVRISVSFDEQMYEGQPGLRVDVIDTGIGIDNKTMDQIFQPFKQGDPVVSQKYGGTGLGLAISHHLTHLLGGKLTAKSILGQGSTFTVVLPTGSLEGVRMLKNPAEVEQEESEHVWRTPNDTLQGIRILLAEDGYDNRELIRAVLNRAGAKVEVAENGRVAVERARQTPYDLILMDMNMPEMDGYSATALLRDRGYQGPIIALTANAMKEDRNRCQIVGCNEYLTKPIDRVHLIKTIEGFVPSKLVHRQAEALGMENSAAGAVEAVGNDTTVAVPSKPIETNGENLVISEFIDDPEISPIIEGFVGRLAGQRDEMQQAMKRGDLDELRRLAHKIKGAGGSYGYPGLTAVCKTLEEAAKSEDHAFAVVCLNHVVSLIHDIEVGYAKYTSVGSNP